MDPLERMFRHLVRTIEASCPAYLTRPFEVGELYQTILPYRHHRRELSLETNQDYEMALTQLLAGYGNYLIVDDSVRETLQRELASPNPDPGAFREFAGSQVALAPEAVRRVRGPADESAGRPSFVAPSPVTAAAAVGSEGGAAAGRASQAGGTVAFSAARASGAASSGAASRGSEGGSRGSDTGAASRPSGTTPRAATPATPNGTTRQPTPITVASGASCRYCGGALPGGRRIVFCPHCGQDLTTVNCEACGTELELGWKFCTSCGRPVGSAAT